MFHYKHSFLLVGGQLCPSNTLKVVYFIAFLDIFPVFDCFYAVTFFYFFLFNSFINSFCIGPISNNRTQACSSKLALFFGNSDLNLKRLSSGASGHVSLAGMPTQTDWRRSARLQRERARPKGSSDTCDSDWQRGGRRKDEVTLVFRLGWWFY